MSNSRRRSIDRIRDGLRTSTAEDPSLTVSARTLTYYLDDNSAAEASVVVSRDGAYLLAVVEDLGEQDRALAARVWQRACPEVWFVDLRAQLIRQLRRGEPERVFAGVDAISPELAPGLSFVIADLFA